MQASRRSLALAALFVAAGAGAADLGTLFNTPAERAKLERSRRGEPEAPAPGQVRAIVPARTPVVTGYVKRSDGKSTVFVDRKPHAARGDDVHRRLEPRVVERHDAAPVATPLPTELPPPAPSAPKGAGPARDGSKP